MSIMSWLRGEKPEEKKVEWKECWRHHLYVSLKDRTVELHLEEETKSETLLKAFDKFFEWVDNDQGGGSYTFCMKDNERRTIMRNKIITISTRIQKHATPRSK